jgi:MFS family permease
VTEPAPPPLSRNRDFALLWTGQVISSVGSQVSNLALPLVVLAMTGSASKAGIVGFAGRVPFLLLQLPAGVLVDRWDRRGVMIVADAGRALLTGGIGLLLALGAFDLAAVTVMAFVEGSLGVFYNLAERAALRSVVAVEQMKLAVARNEARQFGAGLVGGPLGGVLYSIGQVLPFVVDAVSYLATIVAVRLVRADLAPPPRDRPRHLLREMREGFRWLWDQPFLRTCSLLVACANAVPSALGLVVIVRAQDLGADSRQIGLMFAVSSLGGVAGALLAPRVTERVAPRRVVVGSNWLWAATVPLFAFAPNPVALGLLFAVMLCIAPVWNVTVVAYRMAIVPAGLQARVQSVALLIAMSLTPLGPPVAGFLSDRLGAREAILVIACWSLALAIAGSLSRPLRHPPGVPVAELT